jgi:hypothetical protein
MGSHLNKDTVLYISEVRGKIDAHHLRKGSGCIISGYQSIEKVENDTGLKLPNDYAQTFAINFRRVQKILPQNVVDEAMNSRYQPASSFQKSTLAFGYQRSMTDIIEGTFKPGELVPGQFMPKKDISVILFRPYSDNRDDIARLLIVPVKRDLLQKAKDEFHLKLSESRPTRPTKQAATPEASSIPDVR